MKLLQITGKYGGDTLLVSAPDDCQFADVAVLLEDMEEQQGVFHLEGPAVTEAEIRLPEALELDHFSVFVLIA